MRTVSSFFLSPFCLLIMAGLFAQTPPPHNITNEALEQDAHEYPAFDAGPTVEERINAGIGYDSTHKTYIVAFHPVEEAPVGRGPTSDMLNPIRTLTFNSDAVALAIPLLRRSSLTSSHKFVFSDYEVQVREVYADRGQELSAGQTIIVTRPGGLVDIDGKAVRGIETEYPLFRLNQPYLLFLHRVVSGSYYVGPSHAFVINDEKISAAKNHASFDVLSHSYSEVINEIYNAAAERRGNR